jgi:hypothetical protein
MKLQFFEKLGKTGQNWAKLGNYPVLKTHYNFFHRRALGNPSGAFNSLSILLSNGEIAVEKESKLNELEFFNISIAQFCPVLPSFAQL